MDVRGVPFHVGEEGRRGREHLKSHRLMEFSNANRLMMDRVK